MASLTSAHMFLIGLRLPTLTTTLYYPQNTFFIFAGMFRVIILMKFTHWNKAHDVLQRIYIHIGTIIILIQRICPAP